jgi:hypothetical protein
MVWLKVFPSYFQFQYLLSAILFFFCTVGVSIGQSVVFKFLPSNRTILIFLMEDSYLAYNSRGGHGYGNRHRRGFKGLMGVQNSRSQRSIMMDNRLRAPLAKTEDQWVNDPSHFDWPNIDTPKAAVKPVSLDKFVVEPKDSVGFLSSQPIGFVPKKEKVKLEHKTKDETKLTYLERAHLLALTKKFGIDRAEIDHKLSYEENKDYLDRMAKANSYSKDRLQSADLEAKQWVGEYKDFIDTVGEDSERWRDYF